MQVNNEPLRIKEVEGDSIELKITPGAFPILYQRKMYELVHLSGMSEQQAKEYLENNSFILELFSDIGTGIFAVEAEATAMTPIHNPYTGMVVPNDNLPEAEPDPLKFLDTSIGLLQDMSGDLRTQVYDKHDFSVDHMGYIEEAIELIDETVDKLNEINLTEEREKWQSSQEDSETE